MSTIITRGDVGYLIDWETTDGAREEVYAALGMRVSFNLINVYTNRFIEIITSRPTRDKTDRPELRSFQPLSLCQY